MPTEVAAFAPRHSALQPQIADFTNPEWLTRRLAQASDTDSITARLRIDSEEHTYQVNSDYTSMMTFSYRTTLTAGGTEDATRAFFQLLS